MTTSTPPLRVGFLGAGDVSPLHAAGVRAATHAELHGVWSRSQGSERAEEFSTRAYESAEALVADPAIDVVFVLTNLETHAKYATMALRAGKHVLVEKPAASTEVEIRALADEAQQANRLCVPVHNYVHEPALERTKELVTSGALGRIASLSIQYHIHHPDVVRVRYPGVIRQILTHHAYVLQYLAGRPTELCAMKTTLGDPSVPQEDLAMILARLPGGGLAHLCASFAADDHSGDPWTFVVKLIGTEGATRYSYRDWVENRPGVVHSHTFSAYPRTLENCVRHFLERCVRHGDAPLSTLEDAAFCARMLDGAERSVAKQRTVTLDGSG